MAQQPGIPGLQTRVEAPVQHVHIHHISFFGPALRLHPGSKEEMSLTYSKGNRWKTQSFMSAQKAVREVSKGFSFPSNAQVLQHGKLNAHVSPTQLIMVTFAISATSFTHTLNQVNLCQLSTEKALSSTAQDRKQTVFPLLEVSKLTEVPFPDTAELLPWITG